jgi:hypothetical protein
VCSGRWSLYPDLTVFQLPWWESRQSEWSSCTHAGHLNANGCQGRCVSPRSRSARNMGGSRNIAGTNTGPRRTLAYRKVALWAPCMALCGERQMVYARNEHTEGISFHRATFMRTRTPNATLTHPFRPSRFPPSPSRHRKSPASFIFHWRH